MSEHVRKYDDWNIQRPTGGPSAGAQSRSDSDQAVPSQEPISVDQPIPEQPLQTDNTAFFEPGEAISNPFLADSTPPVANPAPQEPAAFSAPTQTQTPQSGGDMTDPDTGLPIPDYMKPFIQEN